MNVWNDFSFGYFEWGLVEAKLNLAYKILINKSQRLWQVLTGSSWDWGTSYDNWDMIVSLG